MSHNVKACFFVSRPTGKPSAANFKTDQVTVPNSLPDNQVRLKVHFLSVDPYMRGRMRTWELNKVQTAWALVEVIESKVPSVAVGSFYLSILPWQEEIVTTLPEPFIPIPGNNPDYLPIASINGLTAIIGLINVGHIKSGETVVISSAAGSVGILAGQIAKNNGCHVIGIAGSDEKCALIKSYGFDAAVNYKTTTDIKSAVKSACPKGTVDVYFDNVGGTISDAILDTMGNFGRIVVCGQISVYNEDDPNSGALQGPRHWHKLIYSCIKIEGFVVSSYAQNWPQHIAQLLKWYSEGKLRTPICLENGIENFGKALTNLFEGENKGKQMVKIS